ncbi:NACHT domain-containing protein [Microbacterium sp. MMO-10]|uniref:NACHT domain-containing protein n=1 Tax=Microbacterium sp. MMO-10 TaxID=3081272 RepID=UPI003018A24A
MIDLSRFNATSFQDLAATLAVAHFGHGIRPMGSGADGGRDFVCESPIRWVTPGLFGEQSSTGYTVFQVKHKDRPGATHNANLSWLWSQVRDELRDWAEKPERRRTPDTLIFVTNVALTPVPGSGGFDTIMMEIKNYIKKAYERIDDAGNDEELRAIRKNQAARLLDIKAVYFWDLYQIDALVAAHADVRWANNALLTAGDVLAAIPTLLNSVPESDLERALRAHARTTLVTGGRIYFDEAGGTADGGMPVHKVMVDLPVEIVSDDGQRKRASVLRYVLGRSGRVLKPKVSRLQKPRHLIITGQPGNGKTTLSKMIVQAHRAAFLRGSAALSDDQRAVVHETDQALADLGVAPPTFPRWPVQINLAEFAQDEAVDLNATLIRRIARDVSAKSDVGEIAPNLLTKWRTRWPWLLVLDGFDEVVDPTLRRRIVEQVAEFANDCEAEDADVLIILTTRPLGFTEEIGRGLFERVDLADLKPRTALKYGEKVTSVRLANDPDRRDLVVRRLREAAADDAFENLLRTPLQVLILSIIVEQAGELSPDRFSLFDRYFQTIMTREKGKIGGFSALIRDHSGLIEEIHQQVGLTLQARAERGETTRSLVTPAELQDIAWAVLERAGFKPDRRDRQLLADIKQAATHRLVLLAPHGAEGYGFDVRSLQEYMAGQYLTSAGDAALGDRLRLVAHSPHWRNTWLFAAGRTFAQPTRHLQQLVVETIENIDENAPRRLGALFPIGPRLALDVLNDGMARSRPVWLERLITQALRLLLHPVERDLPMLTTSLVKLASFNDHTRTLIADGMRARLSSGEGRAGVEAVQRIWITTCDGLKASTQVRGLSQIKPSLTSSLLEPHERPRHTYSNQLLEDEARLVSAALGAVESTDMVSLRPLAEALTDENAALALEMMLQPLLATKPYMRRRIEADVLPTVLRAPLGQELIDEA